MIDLKLIGITGDSGVGKSTLALRLSEKLKCPFLDIDKVILNSESISKEDRTPQISKMKPEYFKLLIDNLENLNSGISMLLNNMVENEVNKISKESDTIIVEWIFLPYLKIWQECDTKILMKVDEELRRSNAINNKLVTKEQYDGCVSMVKVDYSKFDYDYTFYNNYDNKSLEKILDKF